MEHAPEPTPLGPAAPVRARIAAYLPGVVWTAPIGGVYEGDGFSIAFRAGVDEPVNALMLPVRGGGAVPRPLSDHVGLLLILVAFAHNAEKAGQARACRRGCAWSPVRGGSTAKLGVYGDRMATGQ
jgi:hypothetical protein